MKKFFIAFILSAILYAAPLYAQSPLTINVLKGTNMVALVWDGRDTLEYVVYRDGIKLATVKGRIFIDPAIPLGKPHTYIIKYGEKEVGVGTININNPIID